MITILHYYICGRSVWVRVCAHVCARSYMRTYMRTCVRTHVRTHVRTRERMCEGACLCVRERLHVLARVDAHVCW